MLVWQGYKCTDSSTCGLLQLFLKEYSKNKFWSNTRLDEFTSSENYFLLILSDISTVYLIAVVLLRFSK